MRWRPTVTSNDVIMHSAKGSHWKNHKYIKVVDGRYIYPESAGAEMRRRHTRETEERIDIYERLEAEQKRKKQAQANKTKAQRQGMKRTFDEKERQREAARQRQEREALNERNLEAARNKASRKAGAKRIADENAARARANKTARSQQERGMELTAKVRQQRAKKFRDERNAEGRAAVQKQLSRANTLANGRRAERNAEGRAAAKRQIAAGNNEAARQRKLNAVNTTRAAQKQGMKRTAQVNEQAKINRNKQQKADYDRAALAKKNLSAARAKVLRNQRNAEGAASARRQIENASRKAGRAGQYRGAVNKASNIEKRRSNSYKQWTKHPYADIRTRSQSEIADMMGKSKKAKQLFDKADKQMKSWYDQEKGASKSRSEYYKKKNPKNLPARADVAAKQTLNKIGEEAYRTGYKARKAASNVGKSISARARAAWNSASSYKDRFADFESFYKWYKKYGTK